MVITINNKPNVPYIYYKSGRSIELIIIKDNIYEGNKGKKGLINLIINLLII